MTSLPIGIFDSGMGGLTVVKAVCAQLPHEDVLYLGDTARVPYGAKSPETIQRYASSCARFLNERGIKMLLVACNTASSHALSALQAQFTVPVFGAIEPGGQQAARATHNGHIGVIGTLGTIQSQAYVRAIHAVDPQLEVSGQACPLLVPLAEEGWIDDDVAQIIATRYLAELAVQDPRIDTLVLGCTHYPLLSQVLHTTAEQVFGHRIALVDSAAAMARAAYDILSARNSLYMATDNFHGTLCVYVTDACRLGTLAPRFLGTPLAEYTTVDLEP